MLFGTVTRRERVNERPGRLDRVPNSIYTTPTQAPFMRKHLWNQQLEPDSLTLINRDIIEGGIYCRVVSVLVPRCPVRVMATVK